jgi:hypothetical protein
MSATEVAAFPPDSGDQPDVVALIPIVRRIVCSRVSDSAVAEDLVQETLVRVLAAYARVEPGLLEPYAIVTCSHSPSATAVVSARLTLLDISLNVTCARGLASR